VWNSGLGTDHTVSGATATLTAGIALTFGKVCYMGSDGKMELGDADAVATAGVWAMCAEAEGVAENDAGSFLLHGFAYHDAWNWATIGSLLCLDTATAGEMLLMANAPTGTDDVVQILGVVMTAKIVYFAPGLCMVERV